MFNLIKLLIGEKNPPKFKSVEEFMSQVKIGKRIARPNFFHPFFYLMIHKYDFITIGEAYLDEIQKFIVSTVIIKNKNLSQEELINVLYCFIDELCGHFTNLIGKDVFFTKRINLINVNKKLLLLEKEGRNTFVCVIKLKEILGEGRKLNSEFELFSIKGQGEDFADKINEDTNSILISCVISGTAEFQKPRAVLQRPIFKPNF